MVKWSVLFVIRKTGADLNEEDIQDLCHEQIASYKRPKHVFFVDDFPMTASGKVQKYKLRDLAQKELGIECASPTDSTCIRG